MNVWDVPAPVPRMKFSSTCEVGPNSYEWSYGAPISRLVSYNPSCPFIFAIYKGCSFICNRLYGRTLGGPRKTIINRAITPINYQQ